MFDWKMALLQVSAFVFFFGSGKLNCRRLSAFSVAVRPARAAACIFHDSGWPCSRFFSAFFRCCWPCATYNSRFRLFSMAISLGGHRLSVSLFDVEWMASQQVRRRQVGSDLPMAAVTMLLKDMHRSMAVGLATAGVAPV